jgi:hypothetical protein
LAGRSRNPSTDENISLSSEQCSITLYIVTHLLNDK